MPFRPSTELTVVVTDTNGATKTLGSDERDPADRPRNITFGTQLASGFYTAGFNLNRFIDRDNDDIHLLDSVAFYSATGETAYEGFISDMPRSMDDTHTLGVNAVGWMTHAADQGFVQVFVDRDLSRWGPRSTARRVALLASVGSTLKMSDPTAQPDSSGNASVRTEVQGPWGYANSEALYIAPQGVKVASLYYDYVARNHTPTGASWGVNIEASNADDMSSASGSGDIGAASAVGTFTPATPGRFIHLRHDYTIAFAGTDNYWIDWRNLAVYANHGLPKIGTAPSGFAASDVIRYLAALYCPLLDTSGVQDTTYPIRHLTFLEDTKPYDAFLKVNSYHLWNLAVWEDRTLCYSPIDLTDWDWEIRHDEVGNQIGLQGDSIEKLRNGIVVQFTNAATGAQERLVPADYAQLRDESIDNPANVAGRRIYGDPFVIPFPTTAADALELGRIRLVEDNQPKGPGSFTVAHHIKDRAGNYQPAWKVRAGDRIRLTSSASLVDRPRLIAETQYDHSSRTVTIGVDTTLRYLEGYLDRMQTALQAANLA